MEDKGITRRQAVKAGGAVIIGASFGSLQLLLESCSDHASGTSPTPGINKSSAECNRSTNVTRGPYFIDNQDDPNIPENVVDADIPQRADIRTDTEGDAGLQAGVPLALTLAIGTFDGSGTCAPIKDAQVHIWHCNAQGQYSGISSGPGNSSNTSGQNFLRGYQFTDEKGMVTFNTIYPGWYRGRTVHIHIKIRIFDSSGNVTTEATTQLFFNDSTSNAVYSNSNDYSRMGSRDTQNTSDGIYAQEDPTLLVALTGTPSAGFTGYVSLGIQVGTIFGG